MSRKKSRDWKSKYIKWYRYLESVFGNYVPKLADKEIPKYVSENDWIIVPVHGEEGKRTSRLARRPNLWFDLYEPGFIDFGIVYGKLQSVERLRNIIAPYNEYERNQIVDKLAVLDDDFFTRVHKKSKTHHFFETPDYRVVFKQKSNLMNYDQFKKAFQAVDRILDERRLLETNRKFELTPSIDLVSGRIGREKDKFTKVLEKIKPIYEFAISLKTESEARRRKKKREDAPRLSLPSWYCSLCKKETDELYPCESCGTEVCRDCYDTDTRLCKSCKKMKRK